MSTYYAVWGRKDEARRWSLAHAMIPSREDAERSAQEMRDDPRTWNETTVTEWNPRKPSASQRPV